MVKNHPEHEFILIFDRKYSPEFIYGENVKPVICYPQARHPFLYMAWFEASIPCVLAKYNPDVFLSPDGYTSLITNVPTLSVIHDINFHHRPQDLPFLERHYYNFFFPRFARKVNRIATVSEYSRNDIMQSYDIPKEKIDVVYNGANTSYRPFGDDEKQKVKEKYSKGTDYFIFVGTLHPRKNVAALLKAFDMFKKSSGSDIKLLIVGTKMFLNKDMETAYYSMTYAHDVIFTGRLEVDDLQEVMASALALTFVPLFEGFGIPMVEAMYCDVPILASNTTSMPEVAGEAAIYANPFSVDSIAEGLTRIYYDRSLRARLIERGQIQRQNFSWDKSAENLWNSLQRTVNK
jgi:glycosyltransferase involved in cell wall biosynthesis